MNGHSHNLTKGRAPPLSADGSPVMQTGPAAAAMRCRTPADKSQLAYGVMRLDRARRPAKGGTLEALVDQRFAPKMNERSLGSGTEKVAAPSAAGPRQES
jgi:hypothetical protein